MPRNQKPLTVAGLGVKSRSSELPATLHHVAARAGVSIATVSRALNGLSVSAQSQKRVDKAAAELGYVANQAARALRSDRSHTMGLIFFDLRTTLGIELLDSLSESIEDAGYALLISTARGDARRFDVLMRRFLERRVDALFCIHARGDGETLARYSAARVPVLAVISSADGFAQLPLVRPSITEAAEALSQHLHDLRHRRVALIRAQAFQPHMPAIREALDARRMHVEELAISEVGGMSELLASLIAKPKRPTAVVAPTAQAHALLAACEVAGVRVPEDMSIVSLGRIGTEARAPDQDPDPERGRAMSHLAIDPHRIGRAAGGAMLGWLAGARSANKLQVEYGSFVAHETTGKAPKQG